MFGSLLLILEGRGGGGHQGTHEKPGRHPKFSYELLGNKYFCPLLLWRRVLLLDSDTSAELQLRD